jgi:hypothetical protein
MRISSRNNMTLPIRTNNSVRGYWIVALLSLIGLLQGLSWGSVGSEGAAFLEIPVGAGPAAMGAAYSALANDAYAPTWNPAGLGFLAGPQIAGQHLAYLDSLHYEYASAVVPLPRSAECASAVDCPGSALGASVQYLGSGDLTGRDVSGNPTGDFSSYYAAYDLAYGRSLSEQLALGLTAKIIHAKIDDMSASAYAVDLGSIYRVRPNFALAATLTNLGTPLKFFDQGDSLPLEFHVGGGFEPSPHWLFSAEGVVPKTGLASFHVGGQWRPIEVLSLRTGYRTDTVKELSALAGYSLGVGLHAWGQELAYAWLPYGDLGTTHYISLLMKFGEAERAKRNLIQFQQIKRHRTVENGGPELTPDYQQMMQLLNDSADPHMAETGRNESKSR